MFHQASGVIRTNVCQIPRFAKVDLNGYKLIFEVDIGDTGTFYQTFHLIQQVAAGLNKFNGNNFETFWNHADDECSISNNTIACITEDAEGNLWFGTENGLNKLDKRRNGFKRYYFDPEANAANNKIISLFTDKEGTLWVGTISGLYVFDAKEDILKEIPLKELANNSISTIIEKDDLLYIASSMSGLVIYDPRKNRVVRSYRKDSKTLPIPSNYIKDVYIDKKDNIWIGTYKDGVCVIRHDLSEVIYYNTANGLSNNDIRCIKESPAGEMWIAPAIPSRGFLL